MKAFFPRPRSFTGLVRRSYRSKEPPATRAVPHSTTLVACSPIVVAKTARSTTVARQLRICSGSRASVPVLNISRGLSAGLLPEAKGIELFVTTVRRSWICASFLIIASTFAVAPPEKPLSFMGFLGGSLVCHDGVGSGIAGMDRLENVTKTTFTARTRFRRPLYHSRQPFDGESGMAAASVLGWSRMRQCANNRHSTFLSYTQP